MQRNQLTTLAALLALFLSPMACDTDEFESDSDRNFELQDEINGEENETDEDGTPSFDDNEDHTDEGLILDDGEHDKDDGDFFNESDHQDEHSPEFDDGEEDELLGVDDPSDNEHDTGEGDTHTEGDSNFDSGEGSGESPLVFDDGSPTPPKPGETVSPKSPNP